MKTIKKIIFGILGLLAVLSCNKDNNSYAPINQKVFVPELFLSSIESQISDAIGYAIIVNKDGSIAASSAEGVGYIDPAEGSNVPTTINQDINIASVTKTLTAISAIKLMESKGVLLNFPIGIWLPNSWTVSAPMSNITFQELLTHTSGIQQSNTSWNSLKTTVAGPLDGPKSFSYSNVNFALFRAILPKLKNAIAFNNNESGMSTTEFETWMSNEYLAIMQDEVFTPAGISNAICDVTPRVPTRQEFNEFGGSTININSGDWTQTCGGGGYYLSTVEMAKIMAYLEHTEDILTNDQKTTMDTNLLGWDPNDSFITTKGQVYGKDGALFRDNTNDGIVNMGDSGLQTWVGKFPNDVELALSINSIGNGFRSLNSIIQNAYEGAWVFP